MLAAATGPPCWPPASTPRWPQHSDALFDVGCFVAQTANQSRISALNPQRSGSLSSVCLVLYFTIGAIGTAVAAPLLNTLGWQGTTLTAFAVLLLAAALGLTCGPPVSECEGERLRQCSV